MKENKLYWDGNKNKIIRYYFYVQRGLALFNEFRYLFMVIFGIYFALKLTNPAWFVLMFVVSVPLLIIAGWVSVHHIGKVIDYLTIEFSTHFSRYQYTLLEEIRDEIKKNGNSNNNNI